MFHVGFNRSRCHLVILGMADCIEEAVLRDGPSRIVLGAQVHGSKLESAMAWLLQGRAETLEDATHIVSTAGALLCNFERLWSVIH